MTLGKLTELGVCGGYISHITYMLEGDGLPKRGLQLSNAIESKRHKISFYKNAYPSSFPCQDINFKRWGGEG